MSKRDFIRKLQTIDRALSAYDISQRVRLEIGCVSMCQFDEGLNPELLRGYMIKYTDKPNRSPEDPELYGCVVSTQQSQAWQQIVWTKEILQVFDSNGSRANTPAALREILNIRSTTEKNLAGEHPSVSADKNGLILALGSIVPRAYREILREESFSRKYSLKKLEVMLQVPHEKVDFLLSVEFESSFEDALNSS